MTDAALEEALLQPFRQVAWEAGDLSWKLHANQLMILECIKALPPEIKEAVIVCCRRFGKSYLGIVLGLMHSIQANNKKKRSVTRIIGPDVKQTVMIVEYNMAKITDDLRPLGLHKLVDYVKTDKMYKVGEYAGIYLGGFNSQEDSLRGGEADLILIEETGSSKPDDYKYQMRAVLKPQLLKTRGRMVHLTTLPRVPDHPFVLDTIPQAKMDNAYYSYTIYEDPLATPEIIADAIKDCGGVDTLDFRVEFLNEIVRDGSIVVVPDFNRDRHVQPLNPSGIHHGQTTIDFGGVRDLTHACLGYYDFQLNKVCFWDEVWFPANTATSTIVAGVLDMELRSPKTITITQRVVDAPGQLLTDLIQSHAFDCHLPPKDDWRAAINNLALGFTRNEIIVDPRCKLLVQTLSSGTFNAKRTDFARTLALGHCDAIASAMYHYRTQIKDNPYGVQPVSHAGFSYRPPVKNDMVEFAESVVPKQFGKVRKFGRFG